MKIKRKNNSGFTLVELLAVIVIMGILMMVAIPSVTRTIENSRKDTFVDIAKSYGNAVRTLWTSDNLTCEGQISSAVDDGDYYILINSKESAKDSLPVLLDQGGKSSWGNRDVNGYVRVNISTTPGEDTDGDGELEVEPKRVTKFYVALSDGTHGIIDDNTLEMDALKRGNVNMTLSEENLKKVELTVDDGRLDCGRTSGGKYSCAEVKPVKKITGVCVDDQTNVGLTGNVVVPISFAEDDWSTIVEAINSGTYPYQIGDTKEVYMGEEFGTHTVRLANLSTPSECSTDGFSQTACGTVIEFVDVITNYEIKSIRNTVGGWPETKMRTYLANNIYNAMPQELQNIINNTNVVSYRANSAFISTDKIYLLSSEEVWGLGIASSTGKSTRQLDYYQKIGTTTSAALGAVKQYNDSNRWWWLRDANTVMGFYYVDNSGVSATRLVDARLGVSPAFRIG